MTTTSSSPTATTAATATAPRPTGFETLGARCGGPAPTLSGMTADVVCGPSGVVVELRWRPLVDLLPPPAGAGVLADIEPTPGESSRVVVVADAVWISTWRESRRRMGTTRMALFAAVDDAGLASLQTAAGLDAAPLLRTSAGWVEALSRRYPRP